ncbi:MAG: hypothetical protein U1E11_01885 [Dethiobacteria bacterium]|nr:hypothetical protein [Dethiobacteria bacterium]
METSRKERKKRSILITLFIILSLAILILLFLLSPLKDLVFPPDQEPTLALVVVESSGPDPETGLYRVVVEAQLDGKPEPQVTFNRNDGVGEVEDNHSLLFLAEEEIFILKALASNPGGTAEAELELFAGIMVGTSTISNGPSDSPGSGDGDPETDDGENDEDEEDEEESPPPAGDGDSGSSNRPPEIVKVSIRAENITDRLDESFPIRYEEGSHSFNILIEDEDDDEVELEVEASHGIIDNIGEGMWSESRPPNMRAKTFSWQSPANPPGNLEPLNVRLTITASDPSGASDSVIVKLALLPVSDDDEGDSGEIRLVRTGRASVAASADLSGSVTSAGDIILGDVMAGDNLLNRQFKGFLNFYPITLRNQITASVGDGDYTITDAYLVFSTINKVGDPESLAGLVDFKVFPYGSSLVAADFAPGGRHIFNRATDSFNTAGGRPLVLRSATFKDELIIVINAQSKTMQIKLGLNKATNNNNADDFFRFHCSTVSLVVEYEY